MSQNRTVSIGGSFWTSAFLLAFVILKLCHVIDWSWWWVFSPLWIPLAVVLSFLFCVALYWIIKLELWKFWK